MFGTLLESRARRHRRPGGAAVSVAVHMAIIAAITATAVRGGTMPRETPEPVVIHFSHPPAPPPIERRSSTRMIEPGSVAISPVVIRHIDAPTTIPVNLPPIDSSFGHSGDSIVIGHGGSGLVRGIVDREEHDGPSEWRGVDLQTRIVASGKPRYPESLRQAAIDGIVVVRFVVDTTGRIDMSSVSIVSSTHDLFTRAVRDALPEFLFKPAESGGRRLRALAEMPFEFQIRK